MPSRKGRRNKLTHSVRQILCGENPTETFLIINDEDTVRTLGGTQLTSLGYRDVFWDGEGWTGLESRDSSFGRCCLSRFFGGAALMSGYSAFAGELGFDFLPNCLVLKEGPMNERKKKKKKPTNLIPLGLLSPGLRVGDGALETRYGRHRWSRVTTRKRVRTWYAGFCGHRSRR